ncbi:MAG: HNH endonuclease [Vicinamibacteria bacterium]
MQMAFIDSRDESTTTDDPQSELSIAELDQRLAEAVQENERSERLICDYLLAMAERRGYEKFGFADIYYYAEGRFGFSPRKTRYLVHLAQQLQRYQAAVWDYALEVCRRVNGADLDVGHCLELIAGEFIATYAHRAYKMEETACGEDTMAQEHREGENGPSDEEAAASELKTCPDNDDLPCPTASAEYGRTWRFVLERDAYRCQYPDCGSRRELHVHHIVFRSHSGKKGRRRSNSPQNLVTVCVFHHRMIHAGTIGVKGQAPNELTWRRPAMMENLLGRYRVGEPVLSDSVVREPNPNYGVVELVISY